MIVSALYTRMHYHCIFELYIHSMISSSQVTCASSRVSWYLWGQYFQLEVSTCEHTNNSNHHEVMDLVAR